jgi:hypothetical protein
VRRHSTNRMKRARQARAWSAEAGLAADTGVLRDAFEATNELAEDTLDELLEALGIPASQAPPQWNRVTR